MKTTRYFAVIKSVVAMLAAVSLLGACSAEKEPAEAGTGGVTPAEMAAAELLATLTLEQKVGQMIQGEISEVTPEDLRKYGLGSVLNGGGSFPSGNKHATVEDWLQLANDYYLASTDTSEGNAGIPVMWGTDAVHGHNNVIGATIFPHNIGLGAAADPTLVAAISAATAREVKATGIDWVFAPTVAVAQDYRWGRTYESYSSDPALVASYAGGMVEAMQQEGILATAKHFVGDGGTHTGEDRGDTRLPLDVLLSEHGAGYGPAIDAGVMTVMASFNRWNGEKVHGNKQLLTDVLRGDLGFEGFVVSDWNGIGEVAGCTNDSCPKAINAGIDMVMVPEDWLSALENIVAQVKSGEIAESRIDEAVLRILTVKFASGLMRRGLPSEAVTSYRDQIGHPDHRQLARDAVRRSLVLLKNENQLLPLDPRGNYLVVGAAADNIGMQSGGWTISWQGTGNQNTDFPGGTSIYEGIRAQVAAAGGRVFREGLVPEGVVLDAVIAVYGETPYAEMQGDIDTLAWQQPNFTDLSLISSYADAGLPVVSVLISGRPLWVNREINASSAFVAAWLPGSEGAGVADVLLRDKTGAVQFDFVGRLPMAWPAADINADDHELPVRAYAFERGHGLDSGSVVAVAALSEDALSAPPSNTHAVFAGSSRNPWRLFVGNASNWSVVSGPRGVATDDEALAVSVIDYRVQEDARRITWSGYGEAPSQLYFGAEEPVNLVSMAEGGAVVLLEMRVNEVPDAPVSIRMDCVWPCSGELDVTKQLSEMPIAAWQRVAIPLDCFAAAGTDLNAVDVPFLISTAGSMELDLAEVTITGDSGDAQRVACSLDSLVGVDPEEA